MFLFKTFRGKITLQWMGESKSYCYNGHIIWSPHDQGSRVIWYLIRMNLCCFVGVSQGYVVTKHVTLQDLTSSSLCHSQLKLVLKQSHTCAVRDDQMFALELKINCSPVLWFHNTQYFRYLRVFKENTGSSDVANVACDFSLTAQNVYSRISSPFTASPYHCFSHLYCIFEII